MEGRCICDTPEVTLCAPFTRPFRLAETDLYVAFPTNVFCSHGVSVRPTGLADRSTEIMRRQGVTLDSVRAVDHDIATGAWPDTTEHGWERDEWPAL